MKKYVSSGFYCFFLLITLLFSGCSSEKSNGKSSELAKFSDQQFKAKTQEFAQELFARNYTGAHQYFSRDLQRKVTVQQLQSGYEELLKNSELTNFSLPAEGNYNLFYAKEIGGFELGMAERMTGFKYAMAQVIINGYVDDWEDYTAYYVGFAVEDGILKISEIDFAGHH